MTQPLSSWADAAPHLVAVAAGRAPADLVIRGGRVVIVHTREVLDWQVAIARGRFAYVGPDASHCIGPGTEVIEAGGRYLIPGLCDGHMHIESGMLTPAEFAAAVIPHGTTSMFTDPHEIANVLGLAGVRMMHDEALMQPVNIFTQMPSCAPSAPGLETTGYAISAEDVAEAMTWPGIIGLGEMMNFPGVIQGDPQMLAEIAAVPLPIAGLMSDSPAAEVAAAAERMVAAMQDCGCTLNNAYMQHSLLALVVIPEIRISDLGLVDVTRFALTELFETP